MRTFAMWLVLLGSGSLFPLPAEVLPDVAVHCMSPEEVAGGKANAPISLFSDQPLKFSAEVTAPLGNRMDIYGDLFQTSAGGLTLPLVKNALLSPNLQFDKCTEQIAVCALPKLPAVKRRTAMLLRLSVRLREQGAGPRPMGMVNLFVYPRQTAPEWKKMLSAWLGQASLTRIAVIGNLGGLRSFLRREEILFDDLGSQWPDTLDSKTLYLGDYPQAGSDRIPQATGAHVALFLADRTAVPDLPGVYGTTDAAGGMMVKETFPMLLDHLDEDPRSQQTFLLTLGRALNLQALRDLSTWY